MVECARRQCIYSPASVRSMISNVPVNVRVMKKETRHECQNEMVIYLEQHWKFETGVRQFLQTAMDKCFIQIEDQIEFGTGSSLQR